MTIQDLCVAALSRIGVPGLGQTPRAEEITVAFNRLNEWIDALQTERLTIYQNTRTVAPITPNVATYSLSGQRPIFLDHVNCLNAALTPAFEFALTLLTNDAWASIRIKDLTSPLPRDAYYNPTFPSGTLQLYPVPTQTLLSLVIYAPSPVTQFTTLSDTLSVPPGYTRFLRDGLAVELAPEFGRPIDPALIENAREAKAAIKTINVDMADLIVNTGIGGATRRYNILSDGLDG